MKRNIMPTQFALFLFFILALVVAHSTAAQNAPGKPGILEAESDVGVLTQPGHLVFDPAEQRYTITARGENVWFDNDNFHFVWMKVSGDGYLEADTTHEVQAARSAPRRLRIVKHGDYFTMWLAAEGGSFEFAGSSPRIALGNPFYVGLGVCSHEKDKSTTAVFSNVKISGSAETDWKDATLYSTLEEIAVASADRSAVYQTQGRIEAPNWTRDGQFLI